MALCYDNAPRGDGIPIDIWKMDGTKAYLRHYANKLYLTFMLKAGTTAEKMQASKELEICDRKLNYWSKHPNYVHADALAGVEKLKREWAGR